jgi:sporulation integral membrane protein YlbJ
MKGKRVFILALSLSALFLLLLYAEAAERGAYAGLTLCLRVIVPSLFPFFVAARLLSCLGLAEYLGIYASPLMVRLFRVGGEGAAVFVIGVSGGYPLGAVTVANLFRDGRIKKEEAERLLAFCDNSGPAFIIGAAGVGIFESAAAGLLLYLTHILAAALVGILGSFPRKKASPPPRRQVVRIRSVGLAEALTEGIRSSSLALLGICGFVIFFSALVSVLDGMGLFGTLAGALALRTGAELRFIRAALTGVAELGSGIGSMGGLPALPRNLALAAGILGWGGLSVHCQALSVLSGTGLSARRHWSGKLLHAALAAVLTYLAASLFL